MKQRTCFLFTLFSLALALLSPQALANGAGKPVDTVEPFPKFRIFAQSSDEFICWAAAGKSVLKMYQPQNRDSVCQIVSKVRNMNCCLNGDQIRDECNEVDRVERVYARYGVSSFDIGIDFASVYRELQAGRLVNMVINMALFRNETRQGHINTIYKADLLEDGSYRFYVGDSGSYRWFSFLSRDVKLLRDGRWNYTSLNENFTIDRFISVFR
jgi:hypothetical protein